MRSPPRSSAPPRRASLGFVAVLHVVVLGAVLSPLAAPNDSDSFPLSPYPMFSRRHTRVMEVTHAVGIDRDGESEPLAPPVSTGAWEALQSLRTMVRAVSVGRAEVLCNEAAERVRARHALSHVHTVVIETIVLDAVAFLDGSRRTPLARREHARCEVVR